VSRAFDHEGRPAVLLDRTAFYPTSGGQPFDIGRLTPLQRGPGEERRGPFGSAVDVIDTIDVDDEVVHVLSGPLPVGAAVSVRAQPRALLAILSVVVILAAIRIAFTAVTGS